VTPKSLGKPFKISQKNQTWRFEIWYGISYGEIPQQENNFLEKMDIT